MPGISFQSTNASRWRKLDLAGHLPKSPAHTPSIACYDAVGYRYEVTVKKVILGVAALLFLIAAMAAVYSLLFGCPNGGSYRCEQRFNREVCGCPQP